MAPKVGGGSPRYQAEAARLKQQIQAINERLLKLGEATGKRVPLDREQREVDALQAERHNQQADVYNKAYDKGSPVYRQILAALAQQGEPPVGPVPGFGVNERGIPERKRINLESRVPAEPKIDEAVSGKVSYTPRQPNRNARPTELGEFPIGAPRKDVMLPERDKVYLGKTKDLKAWDSILDEKRAEIRDNARKELEAKLAAETQDVEETDMPEFDEEGNEVVPEAAEGESTDPILGEGRRNERKKVPEDMISRYARRVKPTSDELSRIRELAKAHPALLASHLSEATATLGPSSTLRSGTKNRIPLDEMRDADDDKDTELEAIAEGELPTGEKNLGALGPAALVGDAPRGLFGSNLNPEDDKRIGVAGNLKDPAGKSKHKLALMSASDIERVVKEEVAEAAPSGKREAQLLAARIRARLRGEPPENMAEGHPQPKGGTPLGLVAFNDKPYFKVPPRQAGERKGGKVGEVAGPPLPPGFVRKEWGQTGPIASPEAPLTGRQAVGNPLGRTLTVPQAGGQLSQLEKLKKAMSEIRGGGLMRHRPPKPPERETITGYSRTEGKTGKQWTEHTKKIEAKRKEEKYKKRDSKRD